LARKKIKKKDLKKPDEFISFGQKIINWCVANKQSAIKLAAGVLIIFLVVSGFLYYRNQREARAREVYTQAVAYLQNARQANGGKGDIDRAIAKLEETVKNFGSTGVALTATVDLGNAYYQKGDFAKAVAAYKDALQKIARQDPLYENVLASLGATYEAMEEWSEALAVYQRLLQEGKPAYQTDAELCLGRVYEAMGNRNKAMGYYETYLNENPGSSLSPVLKTKLEQWRLEGISPEKG